MTVLDPAFALHEAHGVVTVPGARYTSREFFDLEMERLWPRVWQVACREEEIPNPGDFLEYTIGDQSDPRRPQRRRDIRAFFNACPHRGTRLADGIGTSAPRRSGAGTTHGGGISTATSSRSSIVTTTPRR